MLPSAYNPSRLQQPNVTNSSESSSSMNMTPGIIIIISLVVLSVVLCLLFRNCHHLPYFLSRGGTNHHSFSPSAGDTALIQSLIDSLPFFTFSLVTLRSKPTVSSSAVIEADCAICLSRFVLRDTLRLLPLCCHAFHSQCIDTWLSSGHKTCPLCRSNVYASDTSILRPPASSGSPNGSFHLEIGSVSQRRNDSTSNGLRSYSIGSFDYVVEAETEVVADLNPNGSNAIAGVSGGGSRSWLGEYMDRLSSRTASFRNSQGFFAGSSRRSEVAGVGELDIEASRVGEEINELFRWASGV